MSVGVFVEYLAVKGVRLGGCVFVHVHVKDGN